MAGPAPAHLLLLVAVGAGACASSSSTARDDGGGGGATAGDAAGGGAGGSDASDAAPLPSPCPAAPEPCRVLPLGDSITDGFTFPGGYRIPLFHLALAAGQHLTFVGSQQNGPTQVDGTAFPRQHEGHTGFTIDDGGGRSGISGLTPGSLMTNQPHVVLLMIGTNDIDLQLDVAGAPQRLGNLLDSIFGTAPEVALVLAQITPSQDDALNQRIAAYNAAMPALVSDRAAAGRHIQLVDMYGGVTADPSYKTTLLNDRLHPNTAGYAKLADTWYAALGPLLR